MYDTVEVELLRAIEAYLRATGESQTGFGKRVAGDARLVADIRNGRGIGPKLRRRIEAALTTTRRNEEHERSKNQETAREGGGDR